MYLLKQLSSNEKKKDRMELYEKCTTGWILKEGYWVTGAQSFYQLLSQYPFQLNYAILQINQPYRNLLYHFYPHLKIMLDKEAVIKEFEKRVGITRCFYEEVAVSLQSVMQGATGDIRLFIYDFYHLSSPKDAFMFYENWQLQLNLKEKSVISFVRFMEYYLEEILNYFEMSNCLP
ncbi:hypothetical protein CS063_03965 [Sporanaerobium hydrogeniformans]|uniref:Uncharacterized protein n=1 Tax=Sporanaerobium hydrogeniformans TaxID=3072179 RepID=A0AC61DEX2_9FIRM|nr:hypothetical protein [Sporanaerobium hydrogeniformans]PHV71724.1 hypothetical protein CS063_03965 [Sporanaerobium hydrogeniformans]